MSWGVDFLKLINTCSVSDEFGVGLRVSPLIQLLQIPMESFKIKLRQRPQAASAPRKATSGSFKYKSGFIGVLFWGAWVKGVLF